MSRAIHIGPDMYSFGGTQSVIRAIRDHRIGADQIQVLATWDGPGHVRSLRLTLRAAAKLLRSPSRSVAHFHISTGGAWLREGALIYLARLRRLPVVVTIHGHDFPEFADRHRALVSGVLRHSHHTICLSEAARQLVASLAPLVPSSVIANPIGIDRAAPGASSTPPVVLFAGTIGRRKGVDTLVEAWRILVDEGIEGECRIVGRADDYDPPQVERLTVHGAVHPDSIRELLREVRVVALPSLAEGMPMILTEALAGGRPFVATPVGGTRAIAPIDRMLVPVGDAEALAAGIARYLREPDLAEEDGRLGQEHIAATRSPEVIGAQLRAIYKGIQ